MKIYNVMYAGTVGFNMDEQINQIRSEFHQHKNSNIYYYAPTLEEIDRFVSMLDAYQFIFKTNVENDRIIGVSFVCNESLDGSVEVYKNKKRRDTFYRAVTYKELIEKLAEFAVCKK
ncbi:hypothetical protein MM5_043 [Morganella phage vB_Mm5]